MNKFLLTLILCAATLFLGAQANGNLQYIGDKAILHVWGTHYERGHAQGYFTGAAIMEVFDQFYYSMVTFSNPTYYNYLSSFYQDHFDTDPRIYSEAQGMIAGIGEAGVNLYHSGLQRNLDADDIMQTNAFIDLILVRKALTGQDLELGCASLSSWGISTQQDSLLAGSSVITRWLDWTLYDALVDNPLLIVHHPSESDEQPWLSLAVPGWLGVLSGLNENASWASLNMGNDHPMLNAEGLDPVCQDIRRGLERLDYNADGASNALDVYTALNEGNHLHGTIIHILSENDGQTITAAVETNNSGTAIRYYDQNGNLPGNHLAATNHFRVLTYPTCCDRYANITDSLTTNHHMTAKRQWQVLSGAAGQQNNLSAIQYTPSTGALLWSGATTSLPAYQAPALSLNAQTLFSYNVANPQETLTPALPDLRCHPNPLSASEILKVSSSEPFQNLSLYNLRGQQLFTSASSQPARQLEIELPPLPAGVYLLRATHPQGRQSVRKILLWD